MSRSFSLFANRPTAPFSTSWKLTSWSSSSMGAYHQMLTVAFFWGGSVVNVRTICLDKHPGIFVQHLPKGHPKQNMMVLMKKREMFLLQNLMLQTWEVLFDWSECFGTFFLPFNSCLLNGKATRPTWDCQRCTPKICNTIYPPGNEHPTKR